MSTSLIHDTNTPACNIITGNCPVILAGPHNGYAVPPALYDDAFRPLGLHRSCFDPLSPFTSEDSMKPHSSDNASPIPLNVDLSDDHVTQRTETFYDPFHDTLRDTIQKIRTKFGRVIFLDLHSFTPVWKGQPRDVQIGTLSYRENEIEEHFLSFLPIACAAFGLHFAEIRNDLLTKDKPTREVARIIHDGLQGLLNK